MLRLKAMHASTNQKIKTDVYSRDIATAKDSHGKALDENNQSTVTLCSELCSDILIVKLKF